MKNYNGYSHRELPEDLVELAEEKMYEGCEDALKAFVYEIHGLIEWWKGDWDELVTAFENQYIGEFESAAAFAEEKCRDYDMVSSDTPSLITNNIDWAGVADDLSYDYSFVRMWDDPTCADDVYVFDNTY